MNKIKMNLTFEEFFDLIPITWRRFVNKKDLNNVYINLKDTRSIKPSIENIFKCFKYFDPEDTKAIILGQDPYFISDVADGLCFSCNPFTKKIQPSLRNIIIEILKQFDRMDMINKINCDYINSSLEFLAKENVLLLNNILTVGQTPKSHENYGWEIITNNIIKELSSMKSNIVFLLFGSEAHKKIYFIKNPENHKIIKTSHPSPFSANNDGNDRYISFTNSNCFADCNEYLREHGIEEIDWLTKLLKHP